MAAHLFTHTPTASRTTKLPEHRGAKNAKTTTWPFPPNGNPVPWTKKQIAAYDAAHRDELGEAPL